MADVPKKRISPSQLPESVHPGEPIRASYFNAMLNALRDGQRIWTQADPSTAEVRPQMVRGRNDSGGAIGVYQLVEITGMALHWPTVLTFSTPSAVGVEIIGVTAEPIADTSIGWLYVYGECLVQYAGAVVVGERLGSQNASTIALEGAGSELLVLGTTVIGGIDYALVRIEPLVPQIRDDDPAAGDLYDGRIWYNRNA